MIKINKDYFKKILSEVSNFVPKRPVFEQGLFIKLDKASNSLIAGLPESQIKIKLDLILDDDYCFLFDKAQKIVSYSDNDEITISKSSNGFIKFQSNPNCNHVLNNFLANQENNYYIAKPEDEVDIQIELPIKEFRTNLMACNLFNEFEARTQLNYIYITNDKWLSSTGSTFAYINNAQNNIKPDKFISLRKYHATTIIPFLFKQNENDIIKVQTYYKHLVLDLGSKSIVLSYDNVMDDQKKCLNDMLIPVINHTDFDLEYFKIPLKALDSCLKIATSFNKYVEFSFDPDTKFSKSIFLTSYENRERSIQAKQEIELDTIYTFPHKVVQLDCKFIQAICVLCKKYKHQYVNLYFNEPTNISHIKLTDSINFLIAPIRV